MKLKFNILSIATAAMLGAGLSSCNDWLRVDMEDQVMENTLFSDYRGYRTALNGIYISMLDQYTTTFSTVNMDVMAQCWNVSNVNNHSQINWAQFRYNNLETQNSAIWNGFYTLLANVNVIIEHTEDADCPLTAKQYGLMRGEALALRALFHFDLLRLYGPVFSISDQLECMPYQASSKREILPFLKGAEIIDLIIKDLNEAAGLLKDTDPIVTEGVKIENIVDNGVNVYDESFRQFRLNYYAVNALRARAYLWKGDKTQAYQIATKDIIEPITTEDLTVFPWTTRADITNDDMPDLVFSTEVMFSLYHSKRNSSGGFYTTYFGQDLDRSQRLTFPGQDLVGDSKVASMYESGDYRRNMWVVAPPTRAEQQEAEQSGSEAPNTLAFTKYAPISTTSTESGKYFQYMVPLVRLGEVYLIAAECAPSDSQAREFLNTLRLNRNLPDLDPTMDLKEAILKEFYLETLGEGQLFFFYKRNAYNTMISGTQPNVRVDVSADVYVMPTPLDELAQRDTNSAN